MPIFGYEVPIPYVIIFAIIIVILLALVILSFAKKDNTNNFNEDDDVTGGDFGGLLSKEDFDTKCDDPMLETYRVQWIKADPGEQKDINLILYLAMKQLTKEQLESETEWSQEQCEERMDQLIAELSEKTGIKVISNVDESEFEDYFNSEIDEDEE